MRKIPRPVFAEMKATGAWGANGRRSDARRKAPSRSPRRAGRRGPLLPEHQPLARFVGRGSHRGVPAPPRPRWRQDGTTTWDSRFASLAETTESTSGPRSVRDLRRMPAVSTSRNRLPVDERASTESLAIVPGISETIACSRPRRVRRGRFPHVGATDDSQGDLRGTIPDRSSVLSAEIPSEEDAASSPRSPPGCRPRRWHVPRRCRRPRKRAPRPRPLLPSSFQSVLFAATMVSAPAARAPPGTGRQSPAGPGRSVHDEHDEVRAADRLRAPSPAPPSEWAPSLLGVVAAGIHETVEAVVRGLRLDLEESRVIPGRSLHQRAAPPEQAVEKAPTSPRSTPRDDNLEFPSPAGRGRGGRLFHHVNSGRAPNPPASRSVKRGCWKGWTSGKFVKIHPAENLVPLLDDRNARRRVGRLDAIQSTLISSAAIVNAGRKRRNELPVRPRTRAEPPSGASRALPCRCRFFPRQVDRGVRLLDLRRHDQARRDLRRSRAPPRSGARLGCRRLPLVGHGHQDPARPSPPGTQRSTIQAGGDPCHPRSRAPTPHLSEARYALIREVFRGRRGRRASAPSPGRRKSRRRRGFIDRGELDAHAVPTSRTSRSKASPQAVLLLLVRRSPRRARTWERAPRRRNP